MHDRVRRKVLVEDSGEAWVTPNRDHYTFTSTFEWHAELATTVWEGGIRWMHSSWPLGCLPRRGEEGQRARAGVPHGFQLKAASDNPKRVGHS